MFKDNKRMVVDAMFIKEALKQKLSLEEFLLLLYFDNSYDSIFDIKTISKVLRMDENSILRAYSDLIKKKIIRVKAEKDGYGKVIEKVDIDDFYRDIKIDNSENVKEENKEDIFSKFESSFGRTLSPMDSEIINAWIDKGFSEELIEAALKEAVYNGVTSLRYIDKILYEWNRKGIKTKDDISNKLYEDDEKDAPLYQTSILNFDWLENDK